MLKRKAEKKIVDWIDTGKNALLVSGARQVGKTYCIRECLKQCKADCLEVNLINNPELIEVFDNSKTVRDLEVNLSLAFGYTFTKGKSILFIDEVQECSDIVTKIKFWVDEGSYKYILSGSLLGIELKDIRSVPVGYMDEITMYPMDFEEFLWASDVNSDSLDYIRECYDDRKELSEIVHQKMLQLFRRYIVVGGMPAAVQEYVQSNDMNRVSEIQENIISQYRRDCTKYETEDKKLMIRAVFDAIPSQLLKQNRRFNYADIKKGLRFERLEDSFLWLESAGIAIGVYNATEPKIALEQNKKSSLLKLYLSDVGLLSESYGSSFKLNVLMDNGESNLGGLYENVVAQELTAHGYKAYYYNSHRNGELDFVVEHKGYILPIEVKSGKDYKVHSAISNVTLNDEFQIRESIVFSNYNISTEGKFLYLPVYMCFLLDDDVVLPYLDKIEL